MKPSNLKSIETRLRSDFTALATNLGANETTTGKWTDALISRYTEGQRYYHTTEHINSMLTCRDKHRHAIRDMNTMELAIFFHDWIYNPQGKDNEVESIKCFEEFATESNLSEPLAGRVSEYVGCTITHTLPSRDGDAGGEPDGDLCLFLDFDLEVLSRSDADYSLYAARIRQEYGHFAEADYCAGRIKVLGTFLDRERLYFSTLFHEMYEKIARENLRAEIAMLEGKLRDLKEAS